MTYLYRGHALPPAPARGWIERRLNRQLTQHEVTHLKQWCAHGPAPFREMRDKLCPTAKWIMAQMAAFQLALGAVHTPFSEENRQK